MGFLRFLSLLELWYGVVQKKFGTHIECEGQPSQKKLWNVGGIYGERYSIMIYLYTEIICFMCKLLPWQSFKNCKLVPIGIRVNLEQIYSLLRVSYPILEKHSFPFLNEPIFLNFLNKYNFSLIVPDGRYGVWGWQICNF